MSDLLGLVLSVTTATWAATQAVVCGVAVARARTTYGHEVNTWTSDESRGRGVLLLRPISGEEEGLEERLALPGGASRILFAIRDEHDDALPSAERAVQRLVRNGVDASVVLTHAEGPNLKADQLARALAHLDGTDARPDIVVVADSDVVLTEDVVPRLVASLGQESGPKASFFPVACVPSPTSPRRATLGDRAMVATLSASLHAFPMLVGIDRGLFVGKLFAVQTDALEAIGGFASLRHVLGEDVEIARRFAAVGFGIQALPFVAHATRAGQSKADALSRMGRWLTVVRGQRPRLLASYPLLMAGLLPLFVFAFAFAFASPATGFGGASIWLASVSFLVVALARLAVSDEGRRISGQERALVTSMVDVLLSDVLLLAALGKALASRDVIWRGEKLRLSGGVVSRPTRSSPTATEQVGAFP